MGMGNLPMPAKAKPPPALAREAILFLKPCYYILVRILLSLLKRHILDMNAKALTINVAFGMTKNCISCRSLFDLFYICRAKPFFA